MLVYEALQIRLITLPLLVMRGKFFSFIFNVKCQIKYSIRELQTPIMLVNIFKLFILGCSTQMIRSVLNFGDILFSFKLFSIFL